MYFIVIVIVIVIVTIAAGCFHKDRCIQSHPSLKRKRGGVQPNRNISHDRSPTGTNYFVDIFFVPRLPFNATFDFPKLPFLGLALVPSLEFKLRVLVVEDVLVAVAVAVVGATEDDLSLDFVDDQSIRVKEEEVEEDRSSTGGGGWEFVVLDPLLPMLLEEEPFEADAVVVVL
jgi:hypothetical protein